MGAYSPSWSKNAYEDLFEISLGELSQLVITGVTLHEETLRSAPASVTVYSQEEIRQLGVSRLSELMNFVPGFQSQRNDKSSYSQAYSARGIRSDGSGREILFILDGQRLNSDWDGGNSIAFGLLDLYMVDRVEFIRGPSSPLYGSNAFIGIINITTKATNEVDLSLGFNNTYHASASMFKQFDGGKMELFVKKMDDGGEQLNIYSSLQDAVITSSDHYGLENLHFKLNYKDTSFMYYSNQVHSREFYVVGSASNSENYVDGDTQFAYVDHTFSLPKKWSLKTSFSMSKSRFDLGTEIVPSPTQVVISGEIEIQEPKVEMILTQSLSSGEKNAIGVEWREPRLMDTDANLSGFSSLYLPQAPLTSRTILGVFAQHQNSLSENIDYVLGVRVDDYSNFGSNASPRMGLVWEYNKSDTLKFLYGESFRAPSRRETDIINSSAIVGNEDLNPELAKTAEVVWLHQPKNLSLAMTAFYTELSDVIINLPVTPVERINGGDEEISGLEFELENLWAENLTTRVNASWIFDDIKSVNSEANVFAGASVTYEYKQVVSSVLLNYHSSKQDLDISSDVYRDVPARTFMDLNVNWNVSKSLQWHTHISNALDQSYLSVATSNANNIQGTPNRGVGVISGIRFSF
jgi:outer membrane receptor for ferrienterochelin and colicin